jgi:DNA-binding IclR family transcriptional regulator
MRVDAESALDAHSALDLQQGRLSQSLVNGLALLRCFTAERPLRRIADLAEELGMGRSTTHRYATTLVQLGYLEQDQRRRYRLGLRGADVGLSLLQSMRLRELAQPHLAQLQERTRCMAAMTVLDGADALSVLWLPGHRVGWRTLRTLLPVGVRTPAHATPLGRVLLALAPSGLQAGSHGGTGRPVRSIAAPVSDGRGGTLAAVGLLAPPSAYSARELAAQFGPDLLAVAQDIAAAIASGAQRPDPPQASTASRRPAATASRSSA